ncbi:MAM33 domain-containing protein [Senna tora]|uniref:MAM33 domain-containing protein n=1 Tax=Senna tora TaxID=362788 RepID=A0A834T399_9FABA|nr:MAM33 domain-containing protein [Senna tora]
MERLFRSLRKTLVQVLHHRRYGLSSETPLSHSRRTYSYVSEMRKSAFEGNILRLLRNEIQYELEHSPPKQQPVTKFGPFMVDDRAGEQWIKLKSKFGDEDIKVEVSTFDGSAPAPKSGGGGGGADEEDMQLHITFIVNISKGESGRILEIMCSAWPDTIEIRRLVIRASNNTIVQPYAGPEFKELDDELQDSLYDFLEARGINDELAVFLHDYMKNKNKIELIRWMGTVKSFIEKK